MMMLDIDKSNRQIATFNKYFPWIVVAWLTYEIVAGDRFIGIFLAISFIGFRFINKFIRSKTLSDIKKSELDKPFQWKFEIVVMTFSFLLLGFATLIAIYLD